MKEYTYRYLTEEQAQVIILTSLSIRAMSEDELGQIVEYADGLAKNAGILENVLAGRFGLDIRSSDNKITARILRLVDEDISDDELPFRDNTNPQIC